MIWDVGQYVIDDGPAALPGSSPEDGFLVEDGFVYRPLVKDERYIEYLDRKHQKSVERWRDYERRRKTGSQGRSKAS